MPSRKSLPDIKADLLDANSILVSFPYNELLVSLVKAIPGRQYHAEGHYWSMPAFSLRQLQINAARLGSHVVLSEKLEAATAEGAKRRRVLLAAKAQEDSNIELPTKTALRPYQKAGVTFLANALKSFHGALLADEMGLGKSLQALSIVAISKMQNVLVLCPASIKYVWVDEIKKHYPQLTYVVIDGDKKERNALWKSNARIKVANYELLLHDRYPRLVSWDMIIGDEITRVKNYQTQTAKLLKLLERRYSLGLSGAPVENRLEELHSIMDFVMPGLLGPGWLFVKQHCVKNYWGSVVGYKGIDLIRQRIEPHYLRRLKEDVLQELPAKVYNDVWIEMSKEEWRLYDAIREQILAIILDNPKLQTANVLTEMLRLIQCAADPRLLGENIASSKLAALRELLEAAEGHKVVAFTQFSQLAHLLGRELNAPVIAGDVPTKERAKIIERFQSDSIPLLLSTEAGAYGINLTAADIIVNITQPYNPARLRQREDRLHRIGQKACVQVVNLLARRTIDEHVRRILHRKRDLTKSVFQGETDEEPRSLDRADLMALLGEKEEL